MPDSSELVRSSKGLLRNLCNQNQGGNLILARELVLQQWRTGQFKPMVAELLLVFAGSALKEGIESEGLELTNPSRQSTGKLLKLILEKFGEKASHSTLQNFLLDMARQMLVPHQAVEKKKTALLVSPNLRFIQTPKSSSPARPFKSALARPYVRVHAPLSDEQTTIVAMEKFLENPSDDNYLRLSRLIGVYALTHSHQAHGNSSNEVERSQSVRTVSGGGCSPR